MASFASSTTTGGARKHAWTNKKGMEENVILFYTVYKHRLGRCTKVAEDKLVILYVFWG